MKLVKIPVDRRNASISLLIGEIEVSIEARRKRRGPLSPVSLVNIQKLTVNTIVKQPFVTGHELFESSMFELKVNDANNRGYHGDFENTRIESSPLEGGKERERGRCLSARRV